MIKMTHSIMASLLACCPLGAQDEPVVETTGAVLRFCSDNGVRSIRIDIPLVARNSDGGIAVVPRLPGLTGTWIREIGNVRSEEHKIDAGYRPTLSEKSLNRLESDGGAVVALKSGERAALYGLYLVFMVRREDAVRVGARPGFLLSLGREYELRVKFRLWNDERLQRWRRMGYGTRSDAVVAAKVKIPIDPQWNACPIDPVFANKRGN